MIYTNKSSIPLILSKKIISGYNTRTLIMLSIGWIQLRQSKNKLKVSESFYFLRKSRSIFIKIFCFTVGPPYTLRLKVKFYSSEPNTLREELTRYQFFLQLKLDILEGRLECTDQNVIELCALALQCKQQ